MLKQLKEVGISSLNIDINKPYEIVEETADPISLTGKFQNLADKIKSFEEAIKQDERKFDIYLGRIASKKKITLREFAEKYGLTRERVRQIEVKQEKKLLEILNAYEADINSVFDIYGDIVSISAPEFLPLADYIVVLNNITNGNENIDYSVEPTQFFFGRSRTCNHFLNAIYSNPVTRALSIQECQ